MLYVGTRTVCMVYTQLSTAYIGRCNCSPPLLKIETYRETGTMVGASKKEEHFIGYLKSYLGLQVKVNISRLFLALLYFLFLPPQTGTAAKTFEAGVSPAKLKEDLSLEEALTG